METKTSVPSLLDLSSRPAINTSVWRASFSGMGTSLSPLVHRWAAPAQSGKSSGWPKGWVGGSGVPAICFVSFCEDYPYVLSISAFLSSPFFKRLHLYCIYAVLPYEDCMNMCFSNSSKTRFPPILSHSLKCLLCYSPKNWFWLFKGLFFTVLSPRVDARQAALIFSELEVIVLNWQTKHLSLLVFHFYQ